MQLTLTAQCICSAGTRRSGLFVVGRIDVSLDMTRTLRQAASREAHVSKGEHATCSSRGRILFDCFLAAGAMLGSTPLSMLQLILTPWSVWSETTLCPPSPEILSYHRQITSHLRKQGTLSITDSISLSPTGLYTPAPRHRHQRPGFASPPPWAGRALVRGRHPPWLKTNRPVLALLAENALKPCPHDASAVSATRASARSRLRRAARQYRRACEG